MKELELLLRPGRTIGLSAKDIGRYGAGGTMAVMWLASRLVVQTVFGDEVGTAEVEWKRYLRQSARVGELMPIRGRWVRRTFQPQGTSIGLVLKPERKHFHIPNIQRDLATLYAPGLRAGKRLTWITTGKGARGAAFELQDPLTLLVDPISVSGVIEAHDQDDEIVHLPVSAVIGKDPEASVEDSNIAVAFGYLSIHASPRRVRIFRRDSYTLPLLSSAVLHAESAATTRRFRTPRLSVASVSAR